jgi:bifunctional non-homologous end joining protein LigD
VDDAMFKQYQPMLATLIDKPFDDPEWVFETKWDGFRMIAEIKNGNVSLYSRNGKTVSDRYRPVAKALEKVGHNAVLDGELVALDSHGASRFQLLQNALRTKVSLRYYLFDILFLDGKDVRDLPLIERKEHLEKIIPEDRLLAYSEHRWEFGPKYFKEAQKKKEEGIMAKRAESRYFSGKRTREWLKIKTGYEQEVVIVGFTEPRRSRKYFGSLVLAVREGKQWRYVGHVGTGFDAQALREIYEKLAPLKTDKKTFDTKVAFEATTTWVKPKLVGEVKFTEWTSGGEMRHPAFLGLREDKKPEEVIMEKGLPYAR